MARVSTRYASTAPSPSGLSGVRVDQLTEPVREGDRAVDAEVASIASVEEKAILDGITGLRRTEVVGEIGRGRARHSGDCPALRIAGWLLPALDR